MPWNQVAAHPCTEEDQGITSHMREVWRKNRVQYRALLADNFIYVFKLSLNTHIEDILFLNFNTEWLLYTHSSESFY